MTKQQNIENYINTIIGATVTTSALAMATGCTLPTVLKFIKNNSDRFEKAGRGAYRILAVSAVTLDVSNTITNRPFQW